MAVSATSRSTDIQGCPATFSGGVLSVPCPKESSEKLTPISEMPICCSEKPVSTPTRPGQPRDTDATRPPDGWYTTTMRMSVNVSQSVA